MTWTRIGKAWIEGEIHWFSWCAQFKVPSVVVVNHVIHLHMKRTLNCCRIIRILNFFKFNSACCIKRKRNKFLTLPVALINIQLILSKGGVWLKIALLSVRYQSFRRTLRGRSSRHSRPPLPIDNNRASQTTGESSANTSSETGAASTRPAEPPATPSPSSPMPSSSTESPSSTPPSSSARSSTPLPSTSSTPNSTPSTSTPSTSSAPSSSSASSRSTNYVQIPAVKFLTRHDLIDFLKSKGVCTCI